MHPLVDVAWLAGHLSDPDLVVLDATRVEQRGDLGVPGARRYDLEEAFSDAGSGLPHTQPPLAQHQEALRALGVRATSTLVAYDAGELYAAPRIWWYCRAAGFDRVAVLDGGLQAWTAAGHPVQPLDPPPGGGDVVLQERPGLVVDAAEVERALADPRAAVVDARAAARFRAEVDEPRPGLRRGHVPGAVNVPYAEVQHRGELLPAPTLRALLAGRTGGAERLVLSCGSGVTACVVALAATVAGWTDLAVYDGSWSEWGRPDSGRPVAR